jgi:hypothetical protein
VAFLKFLTTAAMARIVATQLGRIATIGGNGLSVMVVIMLTIRPVNMAMAIIFMVMRIFRQRASARLFGHQDSPAETNQDVTGP